MTGFDPEKHRASQDEVLSALREQFRLWPHLPNVTLTHTVAIEVDPREPDETNFIICVHDDANECKHHIVYPAKGVDEQNPDESQRIVGHCGRVIAAAYN